MNINYQLANVKRGKIINHNYQSISHLPGSKMIDDQDKLIGKNEAEFLTVKTQDPKDIVIVTEKIDGMNCGVYRKGNYLFPLTRKGYDCRTNPVFWIRNFAKYVDDNKDRFFDLLEDEERLCGEWIIKQHTLQYKIKREPFIAFDIIRGNHRERYMDFIKRIERCDFEHTGLVHIGTAIDTETAMKLLGSGFHGVIGDKPEGVVYRYESHKHGYYCSAKFVANNLLGKEDTFKADDLSAWNIVKSRYKKYSNNDFYYYEEG